jgi:hypothetical protein
MSNFKAYQNSIQEIFFQFTWLTRQILLDKVHTVTNRKNILF